MSEKSCNLLGSGCVVLLELLDLIGEAAVVEHKARRGAGEVVGLMLGGLELLDGLLKDGDDLGERDPRAWTREGQRKVSARGRRSRDSRVEAAC